MTYEQMEEQEQVWAKAEREACRRGDHQEAASAHKWRWLWLRRMQGIIEERR